MNPKTMAAAVISVIIAGLLERLFGKYITRNHWLNTGLFILVYPIVLGFFYPEIPSWGVQLFNVLGVAALFISIWSTKRKQARLASEEESDIVGSIP